MLSAYARVSALFGARKPVMGQGSSRASCPAPRAFLDNAKIPGVSDGCKGAPESQWNAGMSLPIRGEESIMSQKAHGTCEKAPMKNLRYGVDYGLTDRICCFNRHYAEHAGYFLETDFLSTVSRTEETTYYDPVSGKPLFIAPRGRTFEEFERESRAHGWPSFRDAEMVPENVRCLRDGECVSVDGTHLGHNLPDRNGNRYCINLVSIAGNPTREG